MNPYDYKKEDFLAWLEERIGKYGYTVKNAPDTYLKAYKSGDPKDLPVLITQEWYAYQKNNNPTDKTKKISWIEKLNWSLKKNNKNSSTNIIDLKLEFEAVLQEKENQFEIYKKKVDDEFEDKINTLKILSERSVSEIKEKFNKSNEEYQKKINLLQNEVKNIKKENNLIGEYKKKIDLLNNTHKKLEKDRNYKDEEQKNIIQELRKENRILNSKIKFLSSSNKATNDNNKLINEKNKSLSNKLIQYEEEIKNIKIKYENSKNKVSETNLIEKLNQKEKEISQLKDNLDKLNQEKNKNEKQKLNDFILLNKKIKNLQLVNNDLLSENQDLNNKLISKEKELEEKIIDDQNIQNKNSSETFSELYNFDKWMRTETNLSESSVKKYVNSVSNVRLDLIRMRNIDVFNSTNSNKENLEKLLDFWLSSNFEKDKKGNNMYSAGFKKFIIFKSLSETLSKKSIKYESEISNLEEKSENFQIDKEKNISSIDELKQQISDSNVYTRKLKESLLEFEKTKRDLAAAKNQLNIYKIDLKKIIDENNDLKQIIAKNNNINKLKSEYNLKTAGELVENQNFENNKIDNKNTNNEEKLFDNYELIFKEWLEERIKKFGPFNYANALQTLSPSKLSDPIAEKWYDYLNNNQEKLRLKTNKIDEIERNIIELSLIVIGTIPTKNSYKKLKREDRTMVSLKSFIHRISNLKLIERIPVYSRYSLEVPKKEYDYHFKFIMNGLGSRFLIDKSYWFVFENLKEFLSRLSSSLSYDQYMPLPREIPTIISEHFNRFGGYFQVARDSDLKIRANENLSLLDRRLDINQLKNIYRNAQDFHNIDNEVSLIKTKLVEYIYTLENKEFEDIKPDMIIEEIEKHKIFALLLKENKEKRLDELFLYDIKNDNLQNTKSETIKSENKENENQEQSLFKLDFAKLEKSKLEQKQTDERLNKIYSIQYDDESEIEEEEEEVNVENRSFLNDKNDTQENNQKDSEKLVYKSYYKSLIKFIEENIDEEESINKKLLKFFINKNSLNEEEFLEEINDFCFEEYNELLLEEDGDIFYLTQEVFTNFKINFNSND